MLRSLLLVVAASVAPVVAAAAAIELATHVVQATGGNRAYVADGVVEATRQTVIAAQIPARIVDMKVRAGDVVKSGQVLVRLDSRAAVGELASSEALAASAKVQLDAARRDYERSERLYAQKYISQAAMDQAEAKWKSAEAQVRATLAQAGIASTQSTFTTLVAPYAGVVAVVNAEQGDMAAPSVPLLTIYDPLQLRVVANVPEGQAGAIDASRKAKIELSAGATGSLLIDAIALQVLPTVDATTHTRQVWLVLPEGNSTVAPGMFARVQLPLTGTMAPTLTVPARAIVRRPEFNAVYVVAGDGKPQLRQVRLGRTHGDKVDIVAGITVGERIALDPAAAARQ
ncbi:MAG: efflux RND transporter periplasmic adaptor subunit [Betaproteobacteria bacterium]